MGETGRLELKLTRAVVVDFDDGGFGFFIDRHGQFRYGNDEVFLGVVDSLKLLGELYEGFSGFHFLSCSGSLVF
jgi:hypothetical protein